MAILDKLKEMENDPFMERIKDSDLKKPTDFLRCSNNFVNNKQALRDHMKLRFKQSLTSCRLSKPKLHTNSKSPELDNFLPKLKKLKYRKKPKAITVETSMAIRPEDKD